MAMIYQDALSSLNPAMTVRAQLKQVVRRGGTPHGAPNSSNWSASTRTAPCAATRTNSPAASASAS